MEINKKNHSAIERILGIPYGTIRIWEKDKNLLPLHKSFLKIINNFNFIIDIANNDYSNESKLVIMLSEIIQQLEKNPEYLLDPEINKLISHLLRAFKTSHNTG